MRVWRTAGIIIYTRMSTRGQNKWNRFCSGVGVISYHGAGNLVILDENINTDNYVRTLSENPLGSENIFGDRNHPHGASNCRMVGVARYIHHSMASADLNIIEHVCCFMGREVVKVMHVTRNDLIRALYNSWLNITVPYLYNLYNSLPEK